MVRQLGTPATNRNRTFEASDGHVYKVLSKESACEEKKSYDQWQHASNGITNIRLIPWMVLIKLECPGYHALQMPLVPEILEWESEITRGDVEYVQDAVGLIHPDAIANMRKDRDSTGDTTDYLVFDFENDPRTTKRGNHKRPCKKHPTGQFQYEGDIACALDF